MDRVAVLILLLVITAISRRFVIVRIRRKWKVLGDVPKVWLSFIVYEETRG